MDDRVIGCEYEALVIDQSTGKTAPYDGPHGIEALLSHLVANFGWQPKHEGENLIALERSGQSITLEPGGQFEMSGAQLRTLREVDDELERHRAELAALADAFPVDFEWHGLNPYQSVDQVNWVPKKRYAIMKRYLPTRGALAQYMMGLTCTVQANLDVSGADDFASKLRVATGIGPLVTALFANSPIYAGKNTGYQSYRAHIWTQVDPDRCGFHRFIFECDAGFEDYTDWALSVPLFFIERDGELVDLAGKATFGDLMAGKVDSYHATLDDWTLHMSTLFPECRARPHLEFRSSDAVPAEAIVACPALWKGVIYDDDCALAAWDLVKSLSFDQRLEMATEVSKHAIRARRPTGAGLVRDLCRDLLEIAHEGLVRQANTSLGEPEDTRFLEPLLEVVTFGKTFADRILSK